MFSMICSSMQCNICIALEIENVPETANSCTNSNVGGISLMRSTLQRCNGCQLVVYCSTTHQRLDWPMHRDLCRATEKLMSTFKVKHPFLLGGQPKNADEMERAILRVKFVLGQILERSLLYHEDELTSFPQFCAKCYSFRRLQICSRCHAIAYCSQEHALEDQELHNRNCGLLQLYYTPYKSVAVSPTNFEFYRSVSELHKKDLCETFWRATLKRTPPQPTASLTAYQLFVTVADFSCIGTVCYALSFTEMRCFDNEKFVIFIVGAVFEQELWFQNIHTQFFFLQYSQISQLSLFFIGPDVEGDDMKTEYMFQGKNRSIQYITYRGLFQNFTKTFNIKPSLIISFNCGFSEHMHSYQKLGRSRESAVGADIPKLKKTNLKSNSITSMPNQGSEKVNDMNDATQSQPSPLGKDTWYLGILEMLLTFDVPIVFTSYSAQEALFDYATVLQIAQSQEEESINVSRIFNARKNPFHDLRPLRNWRLCNEDCIYYRNGYVQALRTRYES